MGKFNFSRNIFKFGKLKFGELESGWPKNLEKEAKRMKMKKRRKQETKR